MARARWGDWAAAPALYRAGGATASLRGSPSAVCGCCVTGVAPARQTDVDPEASTPDYRGSNLRTQYPIPMKELPTSHYLLPYERRRARQWLAGQEAHPTAPAVMRTQRNYGP